MGWISSKVLLYSTGNCVQYPTVNRSRKEYEKEKKKKEYEKECITESLCCTAEMNTTLSVNYTSAKKKKRVS